MPADAKFEIVPLATKTATWTADSIDLKTGSPRRGYKIRQLITAASGTTPTLSGKLQVSTDNTTFRDLVNFAQKTAASVDWETLETNARYVRYLGTIGGTAPSFTVVVDVVMSRP